MVQECARLTKADGTHWTLQRLLTEYGKSLPELPADQEARLAAIQPKKAKRPTRLTRVS